MYYSKPSINLISLVLIIKLVIDLAKINVLLYYIITIKNHVYAGGIMDGCIVNNQTPDVTFLRCFTQIFVINVPKIYIHIMIIVILGSLKLVSKIYSQDQNTVAIILLN